MRAEFLLFERLLFDKVSDDKSILFPSLPDRDTHYLMSAELGTALPAKCIFDS